MKRLLAYCCSLWPLAAAATELEISVELPRLAVAEYHKPYVALWIENEQHPLPATLTVWYDLDARGGEGTKWLKDLRQWWRRTGRALEMPVDGLSGATRGPGTHALHFGPDSDAWSALEAGRYRLRIEAAREVGGRELLEIGFDWPPQTATTRRARGESELGEAVLTIKP